MSETKPKDDSVQITMRIGRDDLELIDEAAKEKRISRSGLFRLAVFKLIDEEKQKKRPSLTNL